MSADDFDAELLAQMREDFLVESQEILDRLGGQLTQLEKDSQPELINTIFREVHTLKGTAGFVGLDFVRRLAHKMEDVFGLLRSGKLRPTPELVDVAFAGLAQLTNMRQSVLRGGSDEADLAPVLARLEAAQRGDPPAAPVSVPAQPSVTPDPAAAPPVVAAALPAAPAASAEPEAETTVRVEVEALDNLMVLVGELITARNALSAASDRLRDPRLELDVLAVSRLTRQLQAAVMATRLTPVERLFNRFAPVVRNLAREHSKQVELIIEGGDTPLDRAVSEQMHDPLLHMLRNSVDHGLETPAARRQAGKAETGRIRLAAARQGEAVILRVSDDGAGLEPEGLRRHAVSGGLLSAEAAAALSDDQARRLIFLPGFSTAAQVTATSGRGVGMDVVWQNVRRLRGQITIESTPGQGTTFVVELPLSLAILQTLLVRVSDRTYALPLQQVRETLRLEPGALQDLPPGELIWVQGEALPVWRLEALLRPSAGRPPVREGQPAVVVRLPRGPQVLVVDELLGKQQMVLKPLSPFLGLVAGVEGAAILPDGAVALVLDLETLLDVRSARA